MGKDKYGDLTETGLRTSLEDIAGENKTEVMLDGDKLVVLFKESDRYYQINGNGSIESFTIYTDATPGELAGTGIENDPFKIECIEDLVTFSIMTGGGDNRLGIKASTFINQYIVLERTLDFNSIFSYNDYTTTKFGDLNTDGVVEDIKTELTKAEEGCIGFIPIDIFAGTFDGKGFEIRNIYINSGQNVGLFRLGKSTATIKNLGITGKITTTGTYAGGVISQLETGICIKDCYNKCSVKSASDAGGIIGYGGTNTNIEISNCYNFGNIEGVNTGGIIGRQHGDGCSTTIYNCYNQGNIKGSYAGGILGLLNGGLSGLKIINCYNKGYIEASYSGGGFVGHTRYGLNLYNCYTTGKIYQNSSYCDVLVGSIWNSKITIKNVYYLYSLSQNNVNIYSSDAISFKESDVNEMINIFDSYVATSIYDLKIWTLGEDGYPTFDIGL